MKWQKPTRTLNPKPHTVRLAGRPVYLDMTVKVKQNWRKDEQLVSAYGA